MHLQKRNKAFVELGKILRDRKEPLLEDAVLKASTYNGWFTIENINLAIASLGEMIKEKKLEKWASLYAGLSNETPANFKIGVIMAGNIPLVGFHDFLCVLLSGNSFVGKLSSDDEILLPVIAKLLIDLEPEFKNKISFISSQAFNKSKEAEINAIIATGSNNSARYFEYYFKKYPHVIRKNRNAIAILTGNERQGDLNELGKDIFQFFGLGCRNVSKIFIPENYKLDNFFAGIVDHGDVINHNKYYNNHQYYRTIYLLNKEKFLDNNFILLKESKEMSSPLATLHFERYKSKEELLNLIKTEKEKIQCIVAGEKIKNQTVIPFGKSQSPELWDYADGVDTLDFIMNIKRQ